MAKCLLKYQWVKLPRDCMPMGKGLLGYWLRLASRAAFRKGGAHYCGHVNQVVPGMWAGGIVGLKRILGVKNRGEVLCIMDMDYEPHPLPTPITELSPERPLCPPTSRTNRKPLYSSATPPTEF